MLQTPQAAVSFNVGTSQSRYTATLVERRRLQTPALVKLQDVAAARIRL